MLRGLLPRRLLNARLLRGFKLPLGLQFLPNGATKWKAFGPAFTSIMWEWGCIPGLWPHTNQIQAYFGRPRSFFPGRLLGFRALPWGILPENPHLNRASCPKYSASRPAFGVTFTRATLWKIRFLIFMRDSRELVTVQARDGYHSLSQPLRSRIASASIL